MSTPFFRFFIFTFGKGRKNTVDKPVPSRYNNQAVFLRLSAFADVLELVDWLA